MACAYLENSFGIFSYNYLFTKLVANHATNHTPNVGNKLGTVKAHRLQS